MSVPLWQPLTLTVTTVAAKPPALWTRVLDYIAGPVKLKVTATGSWEFLPGTTCGPEGMASQGFSDTFLNQNAILGALIGKVGGSASDKPGPTSFSFVAGSFAVVVLDEKTEGALYLTMNDDPKQFPSHGGTVTVTIERARSR